MRKTVIDQQKIETLLNQWTLLLNVGKTKAIAKAGRHAGGLMGRINRTTGNPLIFDFGTYDQQKRIQSALCIELPQLSDLINQKPDIMDGYRWKRQDYIDLYFNHFHNSIYRIKRWLESKGINI